MSRSTDTVRATAAPGEPERIVDIDVAEEMRASFLEYAYSVIYARALPDARDGLKPVQRRILYQMAEMGLRPDRGHVKSARVVGEVMGRLHPHGDSAIYDALVRMAQPFALRLPMIDGHGNFGSLDDGPAAMRYTECRLADPAMAMTGGLDEDVVDFAPNYDGREREPVVLPAAVPNLLVNGAAGIAVGMATSMPPHNLGEVVAAAQRLLARPETTLAQLMRLVPGPDLPAGGAIVGLDGIREAYATGRGSFRIRATTSIEQVSARRRGIIVTALPFNVGPERVIEKIKDLVHAKKLDGIADLIDLTDGERGLRLVIEIKSGYQPEAVLDQLFRLTAMEETFAVNNVALVDGQPRTLGLRELLEVFLAHRLKVVRRRSEYRRRRASERLHLVLGLLVAILDIDEVISVIRSSDDTATARTRLTQVFELTEPQASYILEMPLRRLTKFSRIELESERDELDQTIAELSRILGSPDALRGAVSDELADAARMYGTSRRTVLLEAGAVTSPARGGAAAELEVPDTSCRVLLSATGMLACTSDAAPLGAPSARSAHDVLRDAITTTRRGEIALITSAGRAHRIHVADLPVLPPADVTPSLAGGGAAGEFAALESGEFPVGLLALSAATGDLPAPPLALGTAMGAVKRLQPDGPPGRDVWDVTTLKPGDHVVGAALAADEDHLIFVTSDAQLLHFAAAAVRAQGRAAAGMAGIRLNPGASAIFFGVLRPAGDAVVVTMAGSAAHLAGTGGGSVKISSFAEFPAKGRATGGVRCQRFVRSEDCLALAWAGAEPAVACTAAGKPVPLPRERAKRDASGTPVRTPIAALGAAAAARE